MNDLNRLVTLLLDLSHAADPSDEVLDFASGCLMSELVKLGLMTVAESTGAYFEEAVERTLNLRLTGEFTGGRDGWIQLTEGHTPVFTPA